MEKLRPDQQAHIDRVVRHVRDHLGEPLRVPGLAKLTPYGEQWLREVFRRATGQGIVEYIIGLRLERARELLRTTELPVMEIAYEVGFLTLSCFSRAFRALSDESPSAYRRRARSQPATASSMERMVFRDNFHEESDAWRILRGTWRRERGTFVGSSDEAMQIGLSRPLPENFAAEIRFVARGGAVRADYPLAIDLGAPDFRAAAYRIMLRIPGSEGANLRTPGGATRWSETAVLTHGKEHTLRVELEATTLRVLLDGEPVLSYREVFPATHAARSFLSIWYWYGRLEPSFRTSRGGYLGIMHRSA